MTFAQQNVGCNGFVITAPSSAFPDESLPCPRLVLPPLTVLEGQNVASPQVYNWEPDKIPPGDYRDRPPHSATTQPHSCHAVIDPQQERRVRIASPNQRRSEKRLLKVTFKAPCHQSPEPTTFVREGVQPPKGPRLANDVVRCIKISRAIISD